MPSECAQLSCLKSRDLTSPPPRPRACHQHPAPSAAIQGFGTGTAKPGISCATTSRMTPPPGLSRSPQTRPPRRHGASLTTSEGVKPSVSSGTRSKPTGGTPTSSRWRVGPPGSYLLAYSTDRSSELTSGIPVGVSWSATPCTRPPRTSAKGPTKPGRVPFILTLPPHGFSVNSS